LIADYFAWQFSAAPNTDGIASIQSYASVRALQHRNRPWDLPPIAGARQHS
jgi:hypothetical protein